MRHTELSTGQGVPVHGIWHLPVSREPTRGISKMKGFDSIVSTRE